MVVVALLLWSLLLRAKQHILSLRRGLLVIMPGAIDTDKVSINSILSSHIPIVVIGRLRCPRPEDHGRPVLRVEEHQYRRRMEVAGRQPEVEPLEEDGHRELGLQER